ncbi:hypothetical protein C2E23DRAFT_46631 [Lenzites betulinus]|nr:hypothetical protein C2E23DRAFT_46631 [Lenzites betulinus]
MPTSLNAWLYRSFEGTSSATITSSDREAPSSRLDTTMSVSESSTKVAPSANEPKYPDDTQAMSIPLRCVEGCGDVIIAIMPWLCLPCIVGFHPKSCVKRYYPTPEDELRRHSDPAKGAQSMQPQPQEPMAGPGRSVEEKRSLEVTLPVPPTTSQDELKTKSGEEAA